MTEDSLELVDVGRTFLIDREFKLINARKIALEALKLSNRNNTSQSSSSQINQQSNLQIFDPFKRHDEKRKSSGNSIMNIFRRSAISTSNANSNNNNQGEPFVVCVINDIGKERN